MKKIKLTPSQWRLVMILGFIAALVLSTAVTVVLGLQETTVRIYHTGDAGTNILEARNDAGALEKIGLARVKSYIDSQSAECKLLIDSGNLLQDDDAVRGENMARLAQKMGYDAIVPGEYDFRYGTGRLLELREQYQLPVLSENITQNGEKPFDSCIVKKSGQVKVGIFGLSLLNDFESGEDISFGTAEEALMIAAERVYQLNTQKVDVIVAVVQLGTGENTFTAEQLAQVLPDIDVIIVGGGNVSEDHQEGKTYITGTQDSLRELGAVTIRLKGKRVQSIQTERIPAQEFEDVQPDPEMEALVLNCFL